MSIRSNVITAMVFGLAVSSQAFASDDQQQGGQGDMPPPPPAFSSVDTDSDGEITLAELSEQKLPRGMDAQTLFSEMDSDGDNAVSQDEFESFRPAPPARQ